MLRELIAEFRKPSPRNPDPHHRGATGVWHGSLGAMFGLFSADYLGWPLWLALAVFIGVYSVKEIRDLARGGSIADGIEDAAFVAAGVTAGYFDAMLGLIAINLAGVGVMLAQLKEGAK